MKSFSELTSASQVNNEDLLAISQTSGSGYASKKTTVKDITDKSNLNLAEEYDSTSTYAVDDYVIYESVLYKCIASTTGTFDSTKWTNVVVTDEMGSGGGGTGGHTIIDENGNSMTARAGLQFVGAVEVTDDSTNNRTLVEVLGGDFYNPIIYSTEEREIGVWTDGKPLYEKTLELSSIPSTSPISIDVSALNIDVMASAVGEVYAISNGAIIETLVLPAYASASYYGAIRFLNDNVQILHTGLGDYSSGKIVIQYTKTTDVAGSGTWTPQGVPAVHYSTDEQVIGTWIDGSTLYERTFDFSSNPIDLSANSWTNTTASNSGIDKVINNEAMTSDGININWLGVNAGTGSYIQLLNIRNSTIEIAYLTIQYTKSS